MSEIYTFSQSVMGYSHIKKGTPGQDYSANFQNDICKIAIVSDGHGDPACFRSEVGSKLAVEITLEKAKAFAEGVNNSNLYDKIKKDSSVNEIIKQLTDSIIAQWLNALDEDLKNNPITEEELTRATTYAEVYKSGKKLPHIFGATLIIAIWVKDLLILIQQGDGGCTVFFDDGAVEHPIPEDPDCHANVTTSLCDDDAVDKIRHCILDLSTRDFTACFLGSDGVEDSFLDVTGNDNFYKQLMLDYFNDFSEDKDKFQKYLLDELPVFSQKGSADDVSVSGIVDTVKMKSAISNYPKDIEIYNNTKLYDQYNQKVVSMTRKHGILKDNFEKAQAELKAKKSKLENIKKEKDDLINSISEKDKSYFNEFFDKFNKNAEECKKNIENLEIVKKDYETKIDYKKQTLNAEKLKLDGYNKTKINLENELKSFK